MTYERWEGLIQTIRDKFGVAAQGKEDLDPGPGHCEFVECTTPMGYLRLELEVKPKILEKKTYYTKRAGSGTVVEYRYDPNEHTLALNVLRRGPAGEWTELSASTITEHL